MGPDENYIVISQKLIWSAQKVPPGEQSPNMGTNYKNCKAE
jgi:hypothetical protein